MYQHNKVVYEELKNRLKTDNRVCVVQATGTGKGVIARTLIEEYESVIVVAPTQAILKNYQMNLKVKSDNVQYFTYQAISMMLNPQLDNLAKGVTLLILDEFHRIGAKTWGRKVEYLAEKIENTNGKVVGLSATPVRYLDNERDMSVEFFNGNVVSGLNIVEAVVSGVLPTFKYVVSYYGYEKDLFKKMEERKDKLTDNIKALVANLENNYSIGKIIRQETKDLSDNQKWIVFFSSVEELESFKDTVPVWFDKKVTVYTLHSYGNYKESMNILNDFNNAEKGVNVLLSVNMLNEGVHIQGVDGVIMMRRTISPIVYLQQLGRALQVGGKEPIIFDFIGNYRRLSEYRENSEIFNFIDEIEQINLKLSYNTVQNKTSEKKIIVSSYCEEIFNIIKKLSTLSKQGRTSWTEEEVEILKKYFGVIPLKEIQRKYLPNKTYKELRIKTSHWIRPDLDSIPWSEDEIEVLKKYYSILDIKTLQKYLPNRDVCSIQKKANSLGLYKKNRVTDANQPRKPMLWTEDEINILKDKYFIYTAKDIQKNFLPNRNVSNIQAKAWELGLSKEPERGVFWSDEEIAILTDKIFEYTVEDIHTKFLPNRSIKAIKHKMATMGIDFKSAGVFSGSNIKNKNSWTLEEIEILKIHFGTKTVPQIQKEYFPNRTIHSIYNKALKLGIRNPVPKYEKNKAVLWSEEEVNFLVSNFDENNIDYLISNLPNRTRGSILNKAVQLGLYTRKSCPNRAAGTENPWTLEEDEVLRLYWKLEGFNVKNRLNSKTTKRIKHRLKVLGIE